MNGINKAVKNEGKIKLFYDKWKYTYKLRDNNQMNTMYSPTRTTLNSTQHRSVQFHPLRRRRPLSYISCLRQCVFVSVPKQGVLYIYPQMNLYTRTHTVPVTCFCKHCDVDLCGSRLFTLTAVFDFVVCMQHNSHTHSTIGGSWLIGSLRFLWSLLT